MLIQSLSYAGLGVVDPEAWVRFAVGGLGLQDAGTRDGVRVLRQDNAEWRVALEKAADNDLHYLGFNAANARALKVAAAQLAAADVLVRTMNASELRHRAACAGITFADPDGLRLELVCGRGVAETPFQSQFCTKFLAGDAGLGHVVLNVKDVERSVRFYAALGFHISDFIQLELGPGIRLKITFMHCNARHHTLALATLPVATRLDHMMMEVHTIDEVIQSYHRLLRQGYSMRRHLGRHSNDQMLSFYVTTPAGFDVEIGFDGRLIDKSWTIAEYDRISVWGHEAQA